MTSLVIVHDATHANISHLPAGPSAGYTTGTPGIQWTTTDWTHHPAAIRICQDNPPSDFTADVLDIERGAATNSQAAAWYRAAAANWAKATRPGQRHPAIYTSASNVTPLVNALIAAGVRSGPGLWVANWNLTDAQAAADVVAAAGPFPIVGVQYASGPFYDTSVFAAAWRSAVSAAPHTGPFILFTKAGDTVASIAAQRHTTVQHLLEEWITHHTAADVAQIGQVELPAGTRLYTTNK